MYNNLFSLICQSFISFIASTSPSYSPYPVSLSDNIPFSKLLPFLIWCSKVQTKILWVDMLDWAVCALLKVTRRQNCLSGRAMLCWCVSGCRCVWLRPPDHVVSCQVKQAAIQFNWNHWIVSQHTECLPDTHTDRNVIITADSQNVIIFNYPTNHLFDLFLCQMCVCVCVWFERKSTNWGKAIPSYQRKWISNLN